MAREATRWGAWYERLGLGKRMDKTLTELVIVIGGAQCHGSGRNQREAGACR